MPKQNAQTIIGTVTFLLFLAIILLFNIFRLPIQFSFVFILACIIFTVAFVNTNLALIILIFSMLLSPELKIGGIPGRAVVIRADDIFLFVVFFGWLAKMAINKELGLLRTTALNRPIVIYILICFLSTFFGIIQGYANIKHSVFYLLKYIEYYLLFFMVVNNLKTIKQAKRYIFFMLLTCFLVCLYAWRQIPTGGRLTAPFEGGGGEPNTFAGYLLLMIALILGFILYPESGKQQLFLLGLLGFSVVPFLLTLSRGAWLGFFPMFITFVVLNKKFRFHLILILIIIIILLPYILPQRVYDRMKQTFIPGKTYTILGERLAFEESAVARIESWRVAFERWSRRPFLGYGIPAGVVIDNQYTRVLSETGAIGFMAFIWLMMRIYRAGWQAYKDCKGNRFADGLSLGFIAGFIGLLTQALTAANFIIVRIMEPFWFLAAIVVMLPELQEVSGETPEV